MKNKSINGFHGGLSNLVQTPVIYPGGKTLLLPEIRKLVPPHKVCLDLFGGGGAFILDDSHEVGIYNDINEHAVNFFRVLRGADSDRLIDLIRKTPYSRKEYEDCVKNWRDLGDPVEKAWAWYVIINLGFTHEESCTSFRVGKGNNIASAFANHGDRLPEVTAKLRKVLIENLDFRHAMSLYGSGKDTLIFADPPYITPEERDAVGYAHHFSTKDHIDLINMLTDTDADVILCGYDSFLYHSMLNKKVWNLKIVTRSAQVGNSDYNKRDVRKEHIWTKIKQRGLFES